MINDITRAGELLAQLLSHNPYTYLLARHVNQIGVRLTSGTLLLDLNQQTGAASLQICKAPDRAQPYFWVECGFDSLEMSSNSGMGGSDVVVRTGPLGQRVHPRVEQILIRCFQSPPFPPEDREEIVFPALFGFAAPRTVWQSRNNQLRVLQYRSSDRKSSFCVSSGFSAPWTWPPAEIYDDRGSGAGYELVLKTSKEAIVCEFASWVQHVEQSKSNLLPGNWLEYLDGKAIPGTEVAGFLVSRPISFMTTFPVGSSVAHWHSLVPVTASELALAKRTNVHEVAKAIPDKA